jgi:thioredoxin-related protein
MLAHAVVLLTFVSLGPGLHAAWLTDLGSAKLRMAAENKPMLMLFTGSDWCPACKNLKRDVLSSPEFGVYADANLVLLELDFPRYHVLPATQKQANAELSKAYNIRYYPTMILVDPRGQEVVRPHYDGSGAREFLDTLDKYVHSAPGGQGERKVAARAVTPPPPPAPMFNGAPTAPPPRYNDLVLKNISGTVSRRFALINNQTLAAGEAARIKLGDGEVKVRCIEIRERSVLVQVEGQQNQRELKLAER